jgi:hypothetical protein
MTDTHLKLGRFSGNESEERRMHQTTSRIFEFQTEKLFLPVTDGS